MQITAVPCLSDNYAYLVVAEGSREALVVDPSETAPVVERAEREGLGIVGVLATHHHFDHVGGIEGLRARYGEIPVVGHVSEGERIPGLSLALEHEGRCSLAGLDIRALHVPGHTLGALAYVIDDAVFTGDTLFAAGCGRLFEGTPAMMYESLNDKLGGLPDATRVYFGHEYTAANLAFAMHVEPGNEAVREKAARVAELRKGGGFSTPSTIGEERRTNPFMRCGSPEIVARLQNQVGDDPDPVKVLAAVRAAKDVFR